MSKVSVDVPCCLFSEVSSKREGAGHLVKCSVCKLQVWTTLLPFLHDLAFKQAVLEKVHGDTESLSAFKGIISYGS